MIVLQYRPRFTGEANTFTGNLDGAILLVTAMIRRTDVSRPFEMLLPTWIAERDRVEPQYDFAKFRMHRRSECAFEILAVPMGPGDREEIWLIEIPSMIANEWARAGATKGSA